MPSMPTVPDVRVVTIDFGPLPLARTLNPRLSTDRSLLLATLDVAWTPVDPIAAVARLEERLLAFLPGFADHECRGAERYHVFAQASRNRRPATPGGPAYSCTSFEPTLALAHLIEHAVIDFECAILDERRCSGVTAAHRSPPGRYDLMVECADPHVGRCCLAMAMAWLTAAAQGRDLGPAEREVLAAARLAYRRGGQALWPPGVARALSWPEPHARRALAALRDLGFLSESAYTVNLSGLPEYRLGRS